MSFKSFVFVTLIGFALAIPGEYIPKSFYTINKDGYESNRVNIPRYRRDVFGGGYGGGFGGDPSGGIASFLDAGFQDTFNQIRNLAAQSGANGASGSGHAYSGSFSSGGPAAPVPASGRAYSGSYGSGGAGAPIPASGKAYSGSFSSGGPGGLSGGGGYGGSFAGPPVGGFGDSGSGQVLHSRFAEDSNGFEREFVSRGGGGIQSVSSASGPRGAVSFSSSSTDSDGNVHYNTHSRRF